MLTFFSGHQPPLSVGGQCCAHLCCKPSPRCIFFPSTRLTRFSSCFNRGCFSCGKKKKKTTDKDLKIQSLAGKKSSAFFDSLSLSCACAAPQLPLSLLTGLAPGGAWRNL